MKSTKNIPGGKGSKPRPYSVDQKTFDSNWDRIFGSNEKNINSKTTVKSEEKLS